jgi:DNA-binding response OmpR family regulator
MALIAVDKGSILHFMTATARQDAKAKSRQVSPGMTASAEPTRRVLIIEDEMLIALMLQDMLEDVGLIIAGVASSLTGGLDLARSADAQLAILDINLNGEEAYPIADVLRGRGIPFIFSTGYGTGNTKADIYAVPQVVKPYQQDVLRVAIEAAFAPVVSISP